MNTPIPAPPTTFVQKCVAFYKAHKHVCRVVAAIIVIVIIARAI